jgi:hypothetical protein
LIPLELALPQRADLQIGIHDLTVHVEPGGVFRACRLWHGLENRVDQRQAIIYSVAAFFGAMAKRNIANMV